jgi:RNA polymerase sigma-70 factor (ECF subfamily)
MGSTLDADEVFASFAEKLWVGLPGFEWRCALRPWAYRLARNAANDFVSAAHRRPARNVALSNAPPSRLMERVCSTTALHLQTAAKDRMRELREALAPDDQLLLVLRVDREMDWRDIAVALGEGEPAADAAALEREAARLRKRFERVKDHLRELAREAGLL